MLSNQIFETSQVDSTQERTQILFSSRSDLNEVFHFSDMAS